MKQITLTNDFHNSAVNLRVQDGDTLSAGQLRKARKELCGIADCTCGGWAGERGPQYYGMMRFHIEPQQDGTANIVFDRV